MSRRRASLKLREPCSPPHMRLPLPEASPSLSVVTPRGELSAQSQLSCLTTLLKAHLRKSSITITPKDLPAVPQLSPQPSPPAEPRSALLDYNTFGYMARALVYMNRLDSLRAPCFWISWPPIIARAWTEEKKAAEEGAASVDAFLKERILEVVSALGCRKPWDDQKQFQRCRWKAFFGSINQNVYQSVMALRSCM